MKKINLFLTLVAFASIGLFFTSCTDEEQPQLLCQTTNVDTQDIVGTWQLIKDGTCNNQSTNENPLYCNGNGHHGNGNGHGNGNCNGEGNGNCNGEGNGNCNGEGNGNCNGEGNGNCNGEGNGNCNGSCDSNAVQNQYVGTEWVISNDGTIVMNNVINGTTSVENATWTCTDNELTINTRHFNIKRLTQNRMVLIEEMADGSYYRYVFTK